MSILLMYNRRGFQSGVAIRLTGITILGVATAAVSGATC